MRRPLLFSALCLLLALNLRAGAALRFPQAESDLHPDSAATFGTLPNGVRYVVMPNKEPKGRVSLRLLVLAGSFDETESQRGLAHFLEHMAFNGSTHYAPGTLVEKLQRLGMGFGADTNASTSFNRTLYELELPANDPKTIAEGLQILSDYSGGLLLQQAMVDKERGIILSEKRTRDSVSYRTFEAETNFMEAGTRVPERLPIGLTDIIEKSNRDPFVAFYNMWYRPEKMVVIAVGDMDGAAVEKQIVSEFTPLAARSPDPAPTDLGKVAVFSDTRTLYHYEPEAPDTQIVIASVTPYAHEADDTTNRIKYLPRDLAVAMINQRLDILSKKDNEPFIKAATNVEESFDLYRDASIEITCKPDQWLGAMAIADQELRRALTYGFSPEEVREAVANFRNDFEQAAKGASTRRSDDLAAGIADSIVDGNVFTSPADDLALYGAALSRVSANDCTNALRNAWSDRGRYIFVSGNLKLAPDIANSAVQIAYQRTSGVPVYASASVAGLIWAYTDFGPPGEVAKRTHIDDLDITEVTFANGVRLNLKKTDFEANLIHIAARLGTGQLTEPADKEPGLSTFTNITFSAGGLGKHSIDELRHILAGKTIGALFQSTSDAFTITGDTNKKDLLLEFQLIAATIKDPGYRDEAQRTARKKIEAAYITFEHTERGPLTLHVANLLASGDPRFGLPPENEMIARNLGEEKAWLAPQLASGPLEVSVAGDFDVDTLIGVAAKTIGALPPRQPRPELADKHKVAFPAEPFRKQFGIDTKIPRGIVAIYWPTNDGLDVHRARRLNMLGEILADRLRVKVREQLGSTYSPDVRSTASDVFPHYGYIDSITVVDPAKVEEIEEVVVQVAASIRSGGITQDELDRSKNPAMTAVVESERTNNYWMTVLGKAQQDPQVLDWARSRRADFQSITKEELNGLAQLYFAPENASRVIIKPYATQQSSILLVQPSPAAPAAAAAPAAHGAPSGPPTPTPTPPPDGM
jgi:zinc protease